MKKRKITKRQLYKCLHTIQEHCVNSDVWCDASFQEFCRDPHNVELLHTLQCMNVVTLSALDGNAPPIYVCPLDNAALVMLNERDKQKERILGFVAGVVSTVFAELLTLGIIELLRQLMSQQ